MVGSVNSSGLDDIQKREICAIVSVGGSLTTAAKYVGCSLATIRRVAKQDSQFEESLRRSESGQEFQHLTLIKEAAKKYWKASAWLLERKFPDRYGSRKVDTVTPEELQRVLVEFATIIADEIPVAAHRKNVLARVERLAIGLEAAAQQGDVSGFTDSSERNNSAQVDGEQ